MNETTISDDELRREAERIAETVREAGIDLPDGTTGRIGYVSAEDGLNAKPKPGLYSGQLGVAVYFGAMHEVLGDEEYRRLADEAVTFLLDGDERELVETAGLGAGTGVGSLVYGLSVLADLTGDRRYRDRAGDFVAALSDERIARDDRYDLLLGSAGALTGLVAHWERSNDAEALDGAVRCGEHLLANRYEKWGDYHLWDTSDRDGVLSTSTGMAHGVAGIAYALYRLYGHTGREEFRRAADDAVAFENLFYSGYERNWKANFGGVEHYSNWWCNGLVGFGSARLGSLAHHRSETLERDVERVERGFDPRVEPEDSLCHGTFGQVDFLVELGRKRDERYAERARELAAEAIARRREAGTYRVDPGHVEGLDNAVLFVGTAGIGYALLRVLRPEALPSLLRFE